MNESEVVVLRRGGEREQQLFLAAPVRVARRFVSIAAIGLLVTARVAAAAGCEAASASPSSELNAALRTGASKGLPGVSMAIARGGRILWIGQAGFRDREAALPVTADTGFGIGSITKTFAATVFLQLAQEHHLSLESTPLQLLGEGVSHVPNAAEANWLQVMNHSSGIPTWEFDPGWIREGRGAGMNPERRWKPPESLAFAMAPAHTATGRPGEKHSYSNTNYTLVGLAIEKLSGRAFAAEVRKRILEPLGLTHIYLDGFEEPTTERAQGYHAATREFEQNAGVAAAFPVVAPGLIKTGTATLSPEWSAGGLIASAADLACFGAALRDKPLLSAEERRTMFQFQTIGEGMEVGHGIFRRQAEQDHLLYHGGAVLGYSAFFGWFEDLDASFAILTNLGTMHSGAVPYRLGTLIGEERLPNLIREYVERIDERGVKKP
jgi:D-alanyl-D-alanine carboxypeptidase